MCRSWRRSAFDNFLGYFSRRACASRTSGSACPSTASFSGELTAIADQLVPSHAVVRRKRPSDHGSTVIVVSPRVSCAVLNINRYMRRKRAKYWLQLLLVLRGMITIAPNIHCCTTSMRCSGDQLSTHNIGVRASCGRPLIVCLVAEVCRHLSRLELLIFISSLMEKWQWCDR
jgi:hypothetical protein